MLSGPPPVAIAKWSESIACQVSAEPPATGGGKVSTTWPCGRCVPTAENQGGSETLSVGKGIFGAIAEAIGTIATALIPMANDPARTVIDRGYIFGNLPPSFTN